MHPPERSTEHVPLVNDTSLVAFTVPGAVRPPARSLSLVVKGTFRLPSGELADEQRLPSGDVRLGEEDDLGAPLSHASDFAPFKRRADVTLVGHGYPAEGAAAGLVRLQLGRLSRAIAVFGPRRWTATGGQSAPEPFERVELDHRQAYGGKGYQPNPAGQGHRANALPQLEDPRHLLGSRAARPRRVACFAPVPPSWQQRARDLGSYGRGWLRHRWPFFADDFDWRHFNAAREDLQIAYPRGNEAFCLAGVQPDGAVLAGALPGIEPRAFACQVADGAMVPIPMHLDTVHFDAAPLELVLVWRGVIELGSVDGSELAALLVCERLVGQAEMDRDQATAALREARRRQVAAEAEEVDEVDEPFEAHEDDEPLPEPPAPPSAEAVLSLLAERGSLADCDLTGADLSGLDLERVDLSRAVLTGCSLQSTRLGGALLADASLDAVTAEGCDLSGAQLERADLSGGRFTEASFADAVLEDATLIGSHLERARLCGVRGAGADLSDVVATSADLTGIDLSGCDLTGAQLGGANFRGALLDDAVLYDCAAERAVFDEAAGEDLRCDGGDFSSASFVAMRAPGASFEAANLRGARLSGASMPKANMARARLEGAILDGCSLERSSWRKAQLRGARLVGSSLMQADLQEADLRQADLRNTNLYQVETWGARLGGALLDGALVAGSKLEGRKETR